MVDASAITVAHIDVQGGRGYVWDPAEALWLRQVCGLVGAMTGGVAGFKQQNAVHGLPLELAPEEVTVALEKGWVQLLPCLAMAASAATAAAELQAQKKRRWEESDSDASEDESDPPAPAPAAEQPAWQTALVQGSHFEIPTRPEGPGDDTAPLPAWNYPQTWEDKQRLAVFKDLLSKGYRMTGGSKFGADYLVYPGDPTLYHAQFCVRLAAWDTPLLPALLACACRGSHQARKHLLVASMLPCGDVAYTTFGPVEGFGKSD